MENPLIHQPIPLVLASASPIRAQMLKSAGLHFSVAPSNIDEAAVKEDCQDADLPQLAQRLARAKALYIAKDYPQSITLGADQVCELEGEIINKPGTFERATDQLRQLQGRVHMQHSAFCLVQGEQVVAECVQSASLCMRPLSDGEITAYLHADRPLQSCGSYKFESLGRHLFERVEGDHDTIKGLPLVPLLFTLHRLGAVVIS